ncbi:hypothetical protein PIB30_050951 [Stylosanthes scabra]|uniref:Uncharacterized protein n=1 Tax=Stylosanthes scabra TaxID=79078 RepID=A0ABU6VJE1_9FABA|nr:hypothetical protein [Stylosanthes scabra]
MNMLVKKWNLLSTSCWLVKRNVLHYSQAPRDSLFHRIMRPTQPDIPMNTIINQWLQDGGHVQPSGFRYFIRRLTVLGRFNHALQVSEWLSNERKHKLKSEDIGIHLTLISKVHGLDPAEKYFNSISDSVKDFMVYIALFNCYAQHNSVEKAEAIIQKLKEYYRVKKMYLVTHEVLLKLYARVSDYEKLYSLMREMIDKGLYHTVLRNIQVESYVTIKDIDWLESLLLRMESDPKAGIDWITYILAAKSYIQAGQHEKAFEMLRRSEHKIEAERRNSAESYIQADQHKKAFEEPFETLRRNAEHERETERRSSAYESLLTMYGSIGKRDDVYRIWDMWKRLDTPYCPNDTSYIYMVTALAELNDIDGADRIFEERDPGTMAGSNIRILLNVMVTAYCKNGLVEKAEAFVKRLSKSGNQVRASIWDHLAYGYYRINDMDNAIRTLNKAILARQRDSTWTWKPCRFTLAKCIDYLKDKGDSKGASKILRLCLKRGYFSTVAHDKLSSYVHEKFPEAKAINLMEDYYPPKT